MPKNNIKLYVFTIISVVGYIVLGYFTSRTSTIPLFALYSSIFAGYLAVWYTSEESQTKHYIYIAIGLRLALLFTTPWLSDDIYRFIWDGRLLANGISPFAALPIDIFSDPNINIPGINSSLFQLLNSPEYFTVYPPLSQFVFWLAALISPQSTFGSILAVRCMIITAEIGSLFLMAKLLRHYHLPAKNILLYALNPLVILELTGSLHFEAFVILFILLAIYLITVNKVFLSGLSWSAAVGFKLLPLIFFPLLIRRLKLKTQVILYTTVGITTVLLFLPLYDEALINGLSSSLTLYFQKFEFNASVYYLARTVGYWFKGYNIIAQLGPSLAIFTFTAILIYSLLSKQKRVVLPVAMMWTLLIYFTLSTTVHPWYITTLVALSVFSQYRFVILWSLLIFVTYAGYSIGGYSEPIGLIIFEYLALATFIIYEIRHRITTSFPS